MIGRVAAEHLVKRISGQHVRSKRFDVSFELIARDST
jgi:DNA-binding LacI/PurR family transcriptional regulator